MKDNNSNKKNDNMKSDSNEYKQGKRFNTTKGNPKFDLKSY